MASILIVIGIVTALIIALLAVPVHLAVAVDYINNVQGQINVRWLFGLANFNIDLPIKTNNKKPSKKHHKVKTKNSGRFRNSSGSTNPVALLKSSSFRQHVYRFIKQLLHAAHSRDLHLHLRVGLGDPADTGQLWILLGPLAGLADNLRSATVRIEPEFMESVLEIQSNGKFRIMPLEFVILIIGFLLSPTTWQAWRTLNRSNG